MNNLMNTNINIISATDARKDWSQLIDTVVHEKPQIISRTRDYVLLTEVHLMEDILAAYDFTAEEYIEEDNTVTLSLNEIDLVVNGSDEDDSKQKLAKEILDYAEDFYSDFNYWSKAPNRKKHIPYVMKALILQDTNKIGEAIICQTGKH
jgi:hypothetical protein